MFRISGNGNKTRRCQLVFSLLGVLATYATVNANEDPRPIAFSRDVAPVFAAYCYECHGPDEQQREASLRLDDVAIATAVLPSGAQAIVPGDRAGSEVMRRLLSQDDDRMPPADSHPALSADEIELIGRWIDAGAQWESHWAFEPLDRRPPPSSDGDDWSENLVDRFIVGTAE